MLASCINQGVKYFIHKSNYFLWISLVVGPEIIVNFCIALYAENVLFCTRFWKRNALKKTEN